MNTLKNYINKDVSHSRSRMLYLGSKNTVTRANDSMSYIEVIGKGSKSSKNTVIRANDSSHMNARTQMIAAFAIVLACITMFAQIGVLSAFAAPGDAENGNLIVEYRYLEGNQPTIAETMTQGGIAYKLKEQAAPVLESSLPLIRTYEYRIDGYLTEEDLAALSEIEGLVVTPVSVALKREVDKKDTLEHQETNDVDELPTEKSFEVSSAYDPSGTATVILQRAGVSFTVEPLKPEDLGLPSGYTADIVYRGVETFNGTGYYEAASTYTSDVKEGDENQYVIVATYERTTPPVYQGGTPVADNNGDGQDDETGIPIPTNDTSGGTADDANASADADANAGDENIEEPVDPEAPAVSASGAIIVPQAQLAQIAADAGIPLAPLSRILGNDIPLAAPAGYAAWALVNIMLIIAGFVIAVITLISVFRRSLSDNYAHAYTGNDINDQSHITIAGKTFTNRIFVVVLAMLIMIANVLIFVMTEDVSFPMVLFDKWTAVNAVLLVLEIFAMIFSKKTIETSDAEAFA